MHLIRIFLFVIFIFTDFGFETFAQEWKISINVQDSISKNALSQVSVSLYEVGNQQIKLIDITNTMGEVKFVIKKPALSYDVVISHLSYRMKKIKLTNDNLSTSKIIKLVPLDNRLDEVQILSPVVFKGDTIEFNADAFKLDSSALVEDLFYRLPGVMVWGDGAVTYNGRKVNKIFVNNKEFFGTDFKIALQNIPKNIVDKVQVYDNRTKSEIEKEPGNKRYEANIKLKDGAEGMWFGITSLGIGDGNESDISTLINRGTKKIQWSLGAVKNNTNKNLGSMNQLLANTTFKAGDISKNYNSDFLFNGIKAQKSLGSRLQYDFLDNPENQMKHNLTIDAYFQDNRQITSDSATSKVFFNGEYVPRRRTLNDNIKKLENKSIKVGYVYENNKFNPDKNFAKLIVNTSFERENSSFSSIQREVLLLNGKNTSNEINNAGLEALNKISFDFHLQSKIFKKKNSALKILDLVSSGNIFINQIQIENNKTNQNVVISNDTLINRFYNNNKKLIAGNISLGLNNWQNFSRTLSSRWSINSGLDLEFNHSETKQFVQDILADRGAVDNLNLTLNEQFNKQIWSPYLKFKYKLLDKKNLPYHWHSLNIQYVTKVNLFNQSNLSNLADRTIAKFHTDYIPEVALEFLYYNQKYYGNIKVGFNKNKRYAEIYQLIPLYDNIDPYNIPVANTLLKNPSDKEWYLGQTFLYKNRSVFSFNLKYRTSRSDFVEDLMYDDNKRLFSIVNTEKDTRSFIGDLKISHPVIFKNKNTLTLAYTLNLNNKKSWYVLNGENINYQFYNQRHALSIYYMVLDKFKLGIDNSYFNYKRREYSNDAEGGYDETEISLKSSYFFTKRITLTTDLTNKNTNYYQVKNHYLIWNFSGEYRLLKQKNLAIGISVYDLLNENRGIVFYENLGEMITRYQTKLSQYFMVNLTYYPRFFKK